MTRIHNDNGDDVIKLSPGEWLKLIGILLVHTIAVLTYFQTWTNRVVAVETEVTNIKASANEMRSDVKEILKRTKQ